MLKSLIITGCPRTGSSGLVSLLNQSQEIFVSGELSTFHPDEDFFQKNKYRLQKETIEALANKNWTIDQVYHMISTDNYPLDIKVFGDKAPDYCLNKDIAQYIVDRYGQNSYFIFTDRDFCGIAYSFLHRTKREKDTKAMWYTNSIDVAIERIRKYYMNMIEVLIPNVKNKIIVNYEKSMSDPSYIKHKIYKFLGVDIPIEKVAETYHSDSYDDWKTKLRYTQQQKINTYFDGIKLGAK